MPGPSAHTDFDVIIVGGGLAGLTAAVLLSKSKKKVLLVEKKNYPFNKVCGEYVSNEVLPFLQSIGFNPFDYGASRISRLRVSTPTGKNVHCTLDLGGFGLSRYVMDNALLQLAIKSGTIVKTNTKVTRISFADNFFTVDTPHGEIFSAPVVIGSYGKRDLLDKKMNRGFMQSHTGYMAVKYHIKTDYPVNEIGLDNFEGGYCGISKIEKDKYNLCYLYNRNYGPHYRTVGEMEHNVLFKNPMLRTIFENAEFLFTEPEAINEISFAKKKLVEDHVLMCGDSAGLITPLCGNGMAMAIHSAKLLSELIIGSGISTSAKPSLSDRIKLEEAYQKKWVQNFSRRLFWGRNLQKLFGSATLTTVAISSIHSIPKLEKWLIEQTHGDIIAF